LKKSINEELVSSIKKNISMNDASQSFMSDTILKIAEAKTIDMGQWTDLGHVINEICNIS